MIATDWMGTQIEVGQTVAYCGADVFGWPQVGDVLGWQYVNRSENRFETIGVCS